MAGLSALLVTLAWLVAGAGSPDARVRLASLRHMRGSDVVTGATAGIGSRGLAVTGCGATLATLLIGGPPLALLAAGAGIGCAVVLTRKRTEPVSPADVPMLADLLAGCLSAGVPVTVALDSVADTDSPALAARCRSLATALRAGSPPAEAWRGWLDEPALHALARTAVRTAESGAGAAEEWRRAAAALRAEIAAGAAGRVQRAAVWVVIPLGLCFLPAFVLVGVVPVVLGLLPTLR